MTTAVRQGSASTRVAFIGSMLAVAIVGLFLRINSQLWRPLEHDEISSANAYTYIGYISTIAELRSEHPRDVKRLAAGLTRPFLGWNPNDHLIHELAISFWVFLLGSSEATIRAAALSASIGAALLLMVWARRHTGSLLIATACGLAIVLHPYFIYYGQTARGYSFTALLLLIHLLLVDDAVLGKQSLPRLWLSIFVGFALFLNLASALFIWLMPLYGCMLLREVCNPPRGASSGIVGRFRSPSFQWWFFQATAVAALILLFTLIHLPIFLKSQADYGAKCASAFAALERLGAVIRYLFPGAWMILPLTGITGWVTLIRARSWIAAPIAGSVLIMVLYVMGTRTVPYDRTFGIWIIFSVICAMDLWRHLDVSRNFLRDPAAKWIATASAGLFLISAYAWPHSIFPGPDYQQASVEVAHQIQANHGSPGNSLIVIPFNSVEECRLYLPGDSAFLSLPPASAGSLSIYLPCKAIDRAHDGFRCTYYHRTTAEMVYFPIPSSWSRAATWRAGDCSVYRLNAGVSSGAASINASTPQLIVWSASSPFFDLDQFLAKNVLSNPALPELRFVPGYCFSTPSLVFFNNRDPVPVQKALAALAGSCPGAVTVLTPRPD